MAGISTHAIGLTKRFPKFSHVPATKHISQPLLAVLNLHHVKRVALRRGVWFKALSRLERGILDLTMRCVSEVKSTKLANMLTAIINKLQQTMENTIDKLTRTIGIPLAEKASSIAIGWGNRSAKTWAHDLPFAAYLAVMKTNV
jgi:hypothetical protein